MFTKTISPKYHLLSFLFPVSLFYMYHQHETSCTCYAEPRFTWHIHCVLLVPLQIQDSISLLSTKVKVCLKVLVMILWHSLKYIRKTSLFPNLQLILMLCLWVILFIRSLRAATHMGPDGTRLTVSYCHISECWQTSGLYKSIISPNEIYQ